MLFVPKLSHSFTDIQRFNFYVLSSPIRNLPLNSFALRTIFFGMFFFPFMSIYFQTVGVLLSCSLELLLLLLGITAPCLDGG